MRRAILIVAVSGAAALVGCGADGSERDVSAVVERFQAALADGDGRAACAQLTAAARDALERQEQQPCPRALLGLDLPEGGDVSGSDVYLTSAIAELSGGDAAFLDQTRAGWRISAVGCQPAGANQPYDCELES